MGCALKLPTGGLLHPYSFPLPISQATVQHPSPCAIMAASGTSSRPPCVTEARSAGHRWSGREQGSEYLRSGQAVPGDLTMLGTRKSLEPNNWPNQLP